MADPSRTLVVMRHALAEPAVADDFDRALTDQGRRDSVSAGEWLAAHDLAPDRAVVSSALRTQQTWEVVAAGGRWNLEAEVDRGLYAAGVDTVLDVLRLTDDTAGVVLVIGHNPTMGSLAQLLDDGDGDPTATTQLLAGFPTCSLAVFVHVGRWSDLGTPGSRLTGYHVARAGT